MTQAIFITVSTLLFFYLGINGQIFFAILLLATDLIVLLFFRGDLLFSKARQGFSLSPLRKNTLPILVTTLIFLPLIHLVFRGPVFETKKIDWSAVQALHVGGAGEVLFVLALGFILTAIIFRERNWSRRE